MSKIQYEIISVIKQSNKGNVYLASVEGYPFPVIVKQLKRGNRKVFEALQALENMHIPQIYKVEENEEGLFVAEEYIEGELLSEYLTGQALTEAQCISVAKQLCEGLEKLHSCEPPVIHRDIKPSNIIINSGGIVKIIDFDSSRQYKAESESDTRLLGTEKYAAPEQYGFSQTDCRSDIYSLGIVFGSFPKFASEKKNRKWKKLVEKCTLFAPESRYQSVEEVLRELGRIEKTGASGMVKVVGVAGTLLLLCGALFLMFWKIGDSGKVPQISPISVPVSTSTPSLSPTLTPTPLPMVTPIPTPTPLPMVTPIPTPTPLPTVTPIPTPTPLPTITPTTTPVPEIATGPETEKVYRTTKPEWRDVETDPPEYVELKQMIRERNLVVIYCFKDRLEERDYLLQEKALERPGAEFLGARMCSYETNREERIDERFVELKDNILHIDGAYMKNLAEGYYKIATELRRAGESDSVESGIMLYVAESDVLEEPEWWLQNTTFDYYGEPGEKINVVMKNDSGRRLLRLTAEHEENVDTSLYRIHCDGRAIELSNELLLRYCTKAETRFWVMCTDGSTVEIRIDNRAQK